jgi:hypothetical protein
VIREVCQRSLKDSYLLGELHGRKT